MRYLLFALALGMFPTLGFSFEVDNRRIFSAQTESQVLKVISTADLDLFAGVIEAFQRQNPSVSVDYFEVSSTELVKALVDDDAQFDLAVSSAMDLQTKLANDGMALPFRSEFTAQLPDWPIGRIWFLPLHKSLRHWFFPPATLTGNRCPEPDKT